MFSHIMAQNIKSLALVYLILKMLKIMLLIRSNLFAIQICLSKKEKVVMLIEIKYSLTKGLHILYSEAVSLLS